MGGKKRDRSNATAPEAPMRLAVPDNELSAIHCLFQTLAHRELRGLTGWNCDGLTGLWVSSLPGWACRYREGTKANQANIIATLQGVGDGGQHGVSGGVGIRLGETGQLGDLGNQICFVHGNCPPEKTRTTDDTTYLTRQRSSLQKRQNDSNFLAIKPEMGFLVFLAAQRLKQLVIHAQGLGNGIQASLRQRIIIHIVGQPLGTFSIQRYGRRPAYLLQISGKAAGRRATL